MSDGEFLNSQPEKTLRQALAATDFDTLYATAHTAKGAVGNFGARSTVAAAVALERAAKAHEAAPLDALVSALIERLKELTQALRIEVSNNSEA